MTIGKKIGGGFCIVLLLALVLGVMSYRAMYEGEDAAKQIALDRVPRLVYYSELQNNLILTAYWARTFFTTRREEFLSSALNYISDMRKDIVHLRDLNKVYFFQTTANFLDQFERDAATYENILNTGRTTMATVEKANSDMYHLGNEAESDLQTLITTMTQTQRSFIEAGNYTAAAQYSRNIADVVAVLAQVSDVLENLILAERDSNIEDFEKSRRALPAIAKSFQAVEGNLLRQECKDLCKATLQAYERFSKVAEEVSHLNESVAKADKDRVALFQRMLADAEKMQNVTTDNAVNMVDSSQKSLSAATTLVLVIVAVVMLLGILVAIVITRMIVKPLGETQQFAEYVADGHMEHELSVHTDDETGRLADALRTMVSALKTNISEAHQKSEQAQKATEEATRAMARAEEAARKAEMAKKEGMLDAANQLEGMVEIISSASTELSAQIEQSDRGASESAQRLQEAATAMNEMNATVQEVARNAGSASQASADTKRKAEAGEHVVHQVVESIGEVQEVSMQLKADMAQLNERAQDINRIMGVISDIADQTNLLALNAAIEAARAGEAGRGFAVVADEVRKLAEKTMTSTLDVSNAIRAIQESTDKSMTAVDNAVMRISEATELANQSGAALEEIVATVDATSDQVQAIAAASEEQSAASEEINRSIIEVNDMSRLTADAMSEANQAVSDLANQANRLTNLIQQMKNA